MKWLSRAEEAILLAILKLKDEAYGVSIHEKIKKDTGDVWSFASIYTPLEKLTRKKFVRKIKSHPLPERGGKSRYFYELTPDGKKALVRIKRAQQKIWSGVDGSDLEFDS